MAHCPISLTARKPSRLKNSQLQTDACWVALLVLVVVLPLVLSGCSQFRTELGKPLSVHKGAFVEGETSVQTIIHELGPPNQVSALPDGVAFLYDHTQIAENQIGVSVNVAVLRFLKFVKARSYVDQDILLLTFDDEGRLRGVGAHHWKEDLGGGTAVQLIFSAISLSDASAFRRPSDTHSWGAAWLRPLPSALNSGQTLRSGAHGLQLRSAPSYAGQQTLEMVKPKKNKPKKRPKNSEPF
jgi:hypothetical protein